jgi:3-isopropylmalate dehydrogenase
LKILRLDGDGIGPEVTAVAVEVLHVAAAAGGVSVEIESAPFGGASIDAHGVPVTETTLALASASDAVLLGAVGGPRWDAVAHDVRPEKGLLRLRAALGAYANLRPATMIDGLEGASPLRPERVKGADLLVVRELIGGIYFGEPRGLVLDVPEPYGFNTMIYRRHEVERVARVAFEAARGRRKRVTSVDKANVLEVSRFWRSVVDDVAKAYPDVALDHQYVDSYAMKLASWPSDIDVVVTGNLFGDILSDLAAAIAGSIGMLPSASLGDGAGVYEPVHGSAPDIAGKGVANPLGAVLSVGMLLDHTARRVDLGDAVREAVRRVLAAGFRTADLGPGTRVGTSEMGTRVIDALRDVLEGA